MIYFVINLLFILANDSLVFNFETVIQSQKNKTNSLNVELLNNYSLNFTESSMFYEYNKIKTTSGNDIFVYKFSSLEDLNKCKFFLEVNLDKRAKNFRKLFNKMWTTLSFSNLEEYKTLNTLVIKLQGTKFSNSYSQELGVINSYISCPIETKDIESLKNGLKDIAQLEKKEDKI